MSSYRKINPNLHGGAQNLTERREVSKSSLQTGGFFVIRRENLTSTRIPYNIIIV